MEQEILNSYSRLNSLNVSRETLFDFEIFISMIIEKNKEINIISQETAKKEVIRDRHIIDSAQIIDFIDLNSNINYRFRYWRWNARNYYSNYIKKYEKKYESSLI